MMMMIVDFRLYHSSMSLRKALACSEFRARAQFVYDEKVVSSEALEELGRASVGKGCAKVVQEILALGESSATPRHLRLSQKTDSWSRFARPRISDENDILLSIESSPTMKPQREKRKSVSRRTSAGPWLSSIWSAGQRSQIPKPRSAHSSRPSYLLTCLRLRALAPI